MVIKQLVWDEMTRCFMQTLKYVPLQFMTSSSLKLQNLNY